MNKYLEIEERFITYLTKVKGYSNLTIKSYKRDLDEFLTYIEGESIKLEDVSYDDISLFLVSLYNRQLSKNSIRRMLSTYRQFYYYLIKYYGYVYNPFEVVKSPKFANKLPDFLTFDDMQSFLDLNLKRTDKLKDRDQAILELAFASGLRASEIINLKIKDIDFNERIIKIIGKGNKERHVFFSKTCLVYLNKYINGLRIVLTDNDSSDIEYLFLNNHGKKLTERGLEYIVSTASSKSGFNIHIHPHMLRHSFATNMINNDVDIRVIQEMLGHESIKTTSIYTHVSYEELKRSYDKHFPKLLKEEEKMIDQKGVIFDFNGTMFFDDLMQEKSWYKFAKDEFDRDISEEEFKEHIHGFSNHSIMEYLANTKFNKKQIEDLATKKELIYQKMCEEEKGYLKLTDGLINFLNLLKDNNIKMAICTSSMKPNVDWYYKVFNLERFFKYEDCIYDDGTIKCGKPDPEIYLKAIKYLSIPSSSVMVFEDSYSGLKSAISADVGFVCKIGDKDIDLDVDCKMSDFKNIDIKIASFLNINL